MVTTPMPTLGGMNLTSPGDLITGASTALPPGILGLGIIIIVFGVSLRALDNVPFQQRLLASCFLGFITSIFLVPLGLLDAYWTPALLVLTAIAWFLTKD